MMRSLRLAIRFLTRIPLPGDHEASPEDLARSVAWYPAVGLLVGGLLALAARLLRASPLAPIAAAAILAVLPALITGGLHEDGLADAADGLLSGRGPERALEIMRDSRVGAFGGLALAAVLLLRLGLVAGTDPGRWGLALITSHIAARAAAPPLLFGLDYARAGQGLAEPLIAGLREEHVAAALGGAAALLLLLAGPTGLVLIAAVAGVATACGVGAYRAVGGITGDLAGAAVALSELSCLLIWAWVSPAP